MAKKKSSTETELLANLLKVEELLLKLGYVGASTKEQNDLYQATIKVIHQLS